MKIFLILFITAAISSNAIAQGGIGNKPRTDIVMLSQTVRDSLSDEVFARIMDLKRYAESGTIDSAAPLIAYNGRTDSAGHLARAVNLRDSSERAYAVQVLAKAKKLFDDYPDMRREYFAVFKTKDTPSGQKILSQIHSVNGKKQKMVSWVFYPVGDRLLLGDF